MIAPQFGTICSDPQEAMLCNRLAIWLAKIEEAMMGAKLKCTLQECDKSPPEYLTPEEKRKRKKKAEAVDANLYYTHSSHLSNLIIAIIDDLGIITLKIEEIEAAIDAKLILREWYYDLKDDMCEHPEAQAYHLNKR